MFFRNPILRQSRNFHRILPSINPIPPITATRFFPTTQSPNEEAIPKYTHLFRDPNRCPTVTDAESLQLPSINPIPPIPGTRFFSTTQSPNEELIQKYPHLYRDPNRCPTVTDAESLPLSYSEMDNEALSILGCLGVAGAHKERLVREVMRVDDLDWVQARVRVMEINRVNDTSMGLWLLPYRIGIAGGAITGITSIPLVFHRETALWFNKNFAHEEVPPPEDLDTFWKVGSWTWNWMEPALGTATFVLVAMQLIRSQMKKMKAKPYKQILLSRRADRLANAFPQYDQNIVRDFAKTDDYYK